MPLTFKEGDVFPDISLADETGQETTLADLAGGAPLILIFYRGPW